jgi:GTP-binding protein
MLEKKKDQGFKITEMGGDFYIEAEWLLKILNKTDIDDYESLQYLQRVLENSGVFEELRNRGVQEGDTVIIYDLEFQYVP